MAQQFGGSILTISFICFLLFSCCSSTHIQNSDNNVYVSDLKIIHSGYVHGGIGLDKPYWMDKLVICGKYYNKGLVVHPEDGGKIAFVEFLLLKKGGRLMGLAGWAEEVGITYNGKMRFRFFVDGELIYGRELRGEDCQNLDLDLGFGSVLRIETDDGLDGYYSDQMAFGDLRIEY